MQTETVLIVDDEELVRTAVGRALQRCGYHTVEASDGVEALELLEGITPDVIVLDIDMPRLNGHALLRRLRANGCEVPVVMFAGEAEVSDSILAFRQGAVDFLEKPLDPDSLREAVARALAGPEPRAVSSVRTTSSVAPAPPGASARPPGGGRHRTFEDRALTGATTGVLAAVQEGLRAGALSFDAVPPAVAALIEAQDRGDADDELLAEAVSRDPGLVVDTLREANDAVDAEGRPTVTQIPDDGLRLAVRRLGTRELMMVALIRAADETFRKLTLMAAIGRRFRREAAAQARATFAVAKLTGERAPRRLRRLARVVEVGAPLLLAKVEEQLTQTPAEARDNEIIVGIERAHASFGAATLKSWGVGQGLRALVRNHHHPEPGRAAPTEEAARTLFVLAAGRFAARTARGLSAESRRIAGPTEPECLGVLGISRGAFDATCARLKAEFDRGALPDG